MNYIRHSWQSNLFHKQARQKMFAHELHWISKKYFKYFFIFLMMFEERAYIQGFFWFHIFLPYLIFVYMRQQWEVVGENEKGQTFGTFSMFIDRTAYIVKFWWQGNNKLCGKCWHFSTNIFVQLRAYIIFPCCLKIF